VWASGTIARQNAVDEPRPEDVTHAFLKDYVDILDVGLQIMFVDLRLHNVETGPRHDEPKVWPVDWDFIDTGLRDVSVQRCPGDVGVEVAAVA